MKIEVNIDKEDIKNHIEGLKNVVDNYRDLGKLMIIVRKNGVKGLEKQIDFEIDKFLKIGSLK